MNYKTVSKSVILSLVMAAISFAAPQKGTMTDSRDGKTYKTVKIGKQTWMAENLNYETADSYCYDNDPAKCTVYGRLYTWKSAMKACPNGWHLPNKAEFETLFKAVGGKDVAGKALKSTAGWLRDDGIDTYRGNGIDTFAFSALPAGIRNYNGNFVSDGRYADFWSATENLSDDAYNVRLNYYSEDAFLNGHSKSNGLSVRCLKD